MPAPKLFLSVLFPNIDVDGDEMGRASACEANAPCKSREFTKGALVKGGLAIRCVFNLHIKHGT